jgi:hypothetical protein
MFQFLLHRKQLVSPLEKSNQLMQFKEIVTCHFQNLWKLVNAHCDRNARNI